MNGVPILYANSCSYFFSKACAILFALARSATVDFAFYSAERRLGLLPSHSHSVTSS